MKTILYMAISVTGKTTSGSDDTSWVQESDVKRMDALMTHCGVMVMGKTTYESFGNDLPLDKALIVVMTHDKDLLAKNQEDLIFTDSSPKEILNMLEERGFHEVMLAGGEQLNSSFLNAHLIDELRLIVKPLLIGQGKSLFDTPLNLALQLTHSVALADDTIELTYNIIYK